MLAVKYNFEEGEYKPPAKTFSNSAYLDMIDRSISQLKNGRVVTKSMAELEAMEVE